MAGLLDTALKAEIQQIFHQEGITWPGTSSDVSFAVERVVAAPPVAPPPPRPALQGGGTLSTARLFVVALLCALVAFAVWKCKPDIISG